MQLDSKLDDSLVPESLKPGFSLKTIFASTNSKIAVSVGVFAAIATAAVIGTVVAVVSTTSDVTSDLNFLFINDIHYDPKYVTDGTVLINGVESVCRDHWENATVNFTFGQYGCDTPNTTFQSALDYIPTVVSKPDFILFGGDCAAHKIAEVHEDLHSIIEHVLDKLHNLYPDVPLLMTLGNNDFFPNYGSLETDVANYVNMSIILQKYLNENELETFRQGGYYYRDFPKANLRMLFLNTVIYSRKRDKTDIEDPYNQMAWMKQVAADAQAKKMSIGIAMHVPPGVTKVDGKKGWRTLYIEPFYEIVKTYGIKFVLSAHSHNDMFLPLVDGENTFYALSSPSISPQKANNPAFRVYQIGSGDILNYQQYYTELFKNPTEKLDWTLEYTFVDGYKAVNVSQEQVQKAVNWVKNTAEGRWRYRERILTRASDHDAFYYCLMNSVTAEAVTECAQYLLPHFVDD